MRLVLKLKAVVKQKLISDTCNLSHSTLNSWWQIVKPRWSISPIQVSGSEHPSISWQSVNINGVESRAVPRVRVFMTNKLADVRVITRLVVCVMARLLLRLGGYTALCETWGGQNHRYWQLYSTLQMTDWQAGQYYSVEPSDRVMWTVDCTLCSGLDWIQETSEQMHQRHNCWLTLG